MGSPVECVHERALIYSRLARTTGFRSIPCLLESMLHQLHYRKMVWYGRFEKLDHKGHRWQALAALICARVIRQAHLGLDLLAALTRTDVLEDRDNNMESSGAHLLS